jgi:hypothetical protein
LFVAGVTGIIKVLQALWSLWLGKFTKNLSSLKFKSIERFKIILKQETQA